MNQQYWRTELATSQTFFQRSIGCLSEDDSSYRPTPESLSVSEQVAHVAHTIDWFFEGLLRPEGFSTDWESFAKVVRAVDSLQAAKDWYQRSMENAMRLVDEKPESFWNEPIPEGPMFAGLPRRFVFGGIVDHTAHHRGALTVLARLCGKVPVMPYEDPQ